MKYRKLTALLAAALMAGSLTACGTAAVQTETDTQETASAAVTGFGSTAAVAETAVQTAAETAAGDWFTERDLAQTPDLTGAVTCQVADGQDITITQAGTYLLSGTAKNVTVVVEAGDTDKVQLVLDGLSLTNTDAPAIYVKSADKVFVTTTDSENSLTVTGAFSADGTTNLDGVIFSRDDLVLNGTGTLTIASTDNGVVSKDDLKVTGGTLVITAASDGLEANDAIAVAGGTLTITADDDALQAENDADETQGMVYIAGGSLTLRAGGDAIQASRSVCVEDGVLDLTAREGIEATQVVLAGGQITVNASDDGINAAANVASLAPSLTISGGTVTVVMGSGDTDALDSNGDLTISGGTVDITASSPFDYDGNGSLTGGTVTVNGQTVTQLTNQMMGGGRMGGPGMGQGPMGQNGAQPSQGQGYPDGSGGAFPRGYGNRGGYDRDDYDDPDDRYDDLDDNDYDDYYDYDDDDDYYDDDDDDDVAWYAYGAIGIS